MKPLLLLWVLAFFPLACTTCDLDSASRTEKERKAVLRIVLGEGGGITGMWDGHTITGDGAVYAWRGRGAGENERAIGRLHADTMCVLWDKVKALTAVPPTAAAGSLVRFISVTMSDSTRTYSWKPQLGTDLARTSYQEIYDRCLAAIRYSISQTRELTTP